MLDEDLEADYADLKIMCRGTQVGRLKNVYIISTSGLHRCALSSPFGMKSIHIKNTVEKALDRGRNKIKARLCPF